MSKIDKRNFKQKPKAINYEFDRLHKSLKTCPFLVWKWWFCPKREKWLKVPHDPHSGRFTKSSEEKNWLSFNKAIDFYRSGQFDGVQLVLTPENDFLCIDIDKSTDWDISKLVTFMQPFVDQGAFIEKSFSLKGYHIFFRGKMPNSMRTRSEDFFNGRIEVFSSKKLIAVTGLEIRKSKCNHDETLPDLNLLFRSKCSGLKRTLATNKNNQPQGGGLDDQIVIEKAASQQDKGGINYFRRWHFSGYSESENQPRKHGGMRSEIDFKYLRKLAFWCNFDRDQMRRIFMQSAIYRPEKGENYLKTTIENAIKFSPCGYEKGKRVYRNGGSR